MDNNNQLNMINILFDFLKLSFMGILYFEIKQIRDKIGQGITFTERAPVYVKDDKPINSVKKRPISNSEKKLFLREKRESFEGATE